MAILRSSLHVRLLCGCAAQTAYWGVWSVQLSTLFFPQTQSQKELTSALEPCNQAINLFRQVIDVETSPSSC